MLRKRSRGVATKPAIVAEQSNNQPWLFLEKPRKSTSVFKSFFGFSSQSEPIMTPTSILDSTKAFSALASSIWVVDTKKLSKSPENKPTGIGLALVDDNLENMSKTQKQKLKLVVFGSQLRIQIPNSSVFPCFSPESPGEFGIKTPRSAKLSNRVSQIHPEEEISESILMSEIEQSEDYTCVISHGPNPKTTHIFGNCIVGSCCGVVGSSSSFSSRRNGFSSPATNPIASPENFLSFCHHCRKKLGHGNDIYMYRGEKAFCSEECRCEEMLFDGEES